MTGLRLPCDHGMRPAPWQSHREGLSNVRIVLVSGCLGIAFGLSVAALAAPTPPNVQWSKRQLINIVMVEYRFDPSHLRLRRGTVYRLHLENRGKELHEFTAPGFFAATIVRDPDKLANGGREVVVQPGASTDIDLVPQRVGQFALACADHDWAGMVGQIDVR